ncbi:MAG: hypothetical protein ABIS38_01685 [Sphingomicrobium sp.]
MKFLRARRLGQMGPRRAICEARPEASKLPELADVADSASAAIVIPLIGAEDTPAGSAKSGRKARCDIIASINLVKGAANRRTGRALSLRRVAEVR